MSEALGPLSYGENEQEIFLGHSVTQTKSVSEATAQKIDDEIRKIVDTAYGCARKILTDNFEQLHTLAKALLEYETLTGKEIEALLKGESIVRARDDEAKEKPKRVSSVPSAGRKDEPGLEPEPQPGS